VGLRWAIFGLLAATLPLDEFIFGFHVQYAIAVPVLGLAMLLNVVLARRLRGGPRGSTPEPAPEASDGGGSLVAPVVALDLVAIGAVLAASGGAGNPFSALFFVHVALAAALLPWRATIAVAGLAACVFAGLFALPVGACCPSHPEHGAFSTHLYGMLLAFVMSSTLVAYFFHRVRRALDESAVENAKLRRRAEDAARFEALGALAAGTAHELATPLGTIFVLAEESQHDEGATEEARRRARSIAEQVKRCRTVIGKMRGSARSGAHQGGVDIKLAVERAVQAWSAAHPDVGVVLVDEVNDPQSVPLDAADIEAAVCALLDNALHAIKGEKRGEPIVVRVRREHGAPVVSVEDAGRGIPAHLRGRLGEPFVTTKEPGEGMGLGLYLVRTLVEQIGGRLDISQREPDGTRVTLRLSPASE
jgi:two-component system sensor histidine kinase RegB